MRREWTAKEREFLRKNKHKPAPWLAAQLNRTARSVREAKKRWRLVRQKPSLQSRRAEFLAAYAQGLSDAVVGQRLGVDAATVGRWRHVLGLAPNGYSSITRKEQSRRAKRVAVRRKKLKSLYQPLTKPNKIGSPGVYTEEQSSWLSVIAEFRDRYKRVPTLIEAFRLALTMGYRKDGG